MSANGGPARRPLLGQPKRVTATIERMHRTAHLRRRRSDPEELSHGENWIKSQIDAYRNLA